MQYINRFLKSLSFLIILNIHTACSGDQKVKTFDIIIYSATVIDGSGAEAATYDVGIVNGKIAELGDLTERSASRIIDGEGFILSPGFIDMHAHISEIMGMPKAENFVRQGVTTVLGGPDGTSPLPLRPYLDSLKNNNLGINAAFLIGHNSIRKKISGRENREWTPSELDSAKSMVREAMLAGAYGLSTGLKYIPGSFAEVDEIIELAKVAAEYKGIYTSHLRDEGTGLIAAVKEAIKIAAAADIPVILTHHKLMGPKMWGKSSETLSLIDSANEAGLSIWMDQYPYTASKTSIDVVFPNWALEGQPDQFEKKWRAGDNWQKLEEDIVNILNTERTGSDLERIQLSSVPFKPEVQGLSLQHWLETENKDISLNSAAKLLMENRLKGPMTAIYHVIDSTDLQQILKHPRTMIGSDGSLTTYKEGYPHPRSYGTFPHLIAYYQRELNVLSLPEMIYKMTGLPAKVLGLEKRGLIKEDFEADLVLFDLEKIKARSSYTNPHQYPEGIKYVLVNGTFAVDNGYFTGKAKGQALIK